MGQYKIIRTDTADAGLRKIILSIAENFGTETAVKKLDDIERQISLLSDHPYMGMDPKYMVLRRQKFKVLILEKNLVFYKINEAKRLVTVYAIVRCV